MIGRVASFFLLLVAGALLGGRAAGTFGWGAAAGAIAWFLVDLLRASRVLRWLRRTQGAAPPRLFGMWGDLVERTHRALRSREHRTGEAQMRLQEFLAAIQASPNGVVLLDPTGHIEWCNETAATHFGLDAQRDLMQYVGNLLRDPGFMAYYAAGDFSREVVIPGRGSTPSRPVRVSVHLHPYGEGRKLLLSRDVTALEQAEMMRRDFVANVSHEIRTPLTVLAGFVETLQNLPLAEADRAHYLGLMSQQAQRMQTLVNDLLTLSRLEGSPPPTASEWTPLANLVAHCENEARALSQTLGKHHALRVEPVAALDVAGSGNELLSAMSNLVSNAVRYTPAGKGIALSTRRLPDGGLEFSVQDQGPGIAPEHLPRLTERFYRVDRSRSRETGGTGLGLAIVKHVVQRHGGELRIASTPGEGSTFAIVLPPSRVRPVLTQSAVASAPPATAAP